MTIEECVVSSFRQHMSSAVCCLTSALCERHCITGAAPPVTPHPTFPSPDSNTTTP